MWEMVCCVSVWRSIEATTKDLLWYLNNLINRQRLLVDTSGCLKGFAIIYNAILQIAIRTN